MLSTPKYRRLVSLAKDLGFEIRLSYVLLETPQLNVARVRQRVEQGGHSVPEDKIVARYTRSLEQLPWFLGQADRGWIYDNSGTKPRLICRKSEGIIVLDDDALPQIVAIVRAMSGE